MPDYRYQYIPKQFKEILNKDEQIKKQELEVCKAFNTGSLNELRNTVRTLELIVTKDMIPKDDPYEEDMKKLNAELKKEQDKLMAKYREDLEGAECADMVDKPDLRPPRGYLEAKFQLLENFFGRVGLGMQHEQDGHF